MPSEEPRTWHAPAHTVLAKSTYRVLCRHDLYADSLLAIAQLDVPEVSLLAPFQAG